MSNQCTYEMHIKGKKRNIEEFLKVMRDYNRPTHFWNVCDFDKVDRDSYKGDTPDETVYVVYGNCENSVYECMFTGLGTAAMQHSDEGYTSLPEETKRLNLDIEVYSDNSTLSFQEHYHYRNGEYISHDCRSTTAFCYPELYDDLKAALDALDESDEKDEFFEEWKAKNNAPEEMEWYDVDSDCRFIVGGFWEEGFWEFSI